MDFIQVQSANVTAEETLTLQGSMPASETIQEVVTFLDENPGYETGLTTAFDNVTLRDDTPNNASLGEFLSRPIRLTSFTWAESDAIGTTVSLDPWQQFFNNPSLKYKLNNFSFIQCDLKIKVIINASPFYYGAMLMSYQPMPNLGGGYQSITNDSGTRYFIPYSQRPHLWIYPQANSGGEMTLPFFFNRNWARLQHYQDFYDLGQLKFINYTALDSANGATGQGVTISVFAWAENVKLAGPSAGLAMTVQTRDEMVSRPSAIASAIAAAAGNLKRIPVISSFATATEVGAKFVAGGARALGFTNDPVVKDVDALKPTAMAPLSTSEISYPVEKLTLDHKNELSIDPGLAGLPGIDEMSISYLAQKESYLCTTTFSSTHAVDASLFSSPVTPLMHDVDSAAQAKVYMTPMAWLYTMFGNWRGDIIFRFRFIATPFHKGRVRIVYDPQGTAASNIINQNSVTNVVFTQIVDIGKDTDVEIRVPYQQAIAWLSNGLQPTFGNIMWSTSSSPTFTRYEGYDNGFISMKVLTKLTAPIATSSVPIIVSVRGADNLEFANPSSLLSDTTTVWSYLAPQTEDEPITQSLIAGGAVHAPAPERYLVNFGEAVTSLRQILRRSSLVHVRSLGTNTTNPIVLYDRYQTRYPPHPGFDVYGLDSATGIINTGANFAYNFVFLTYIQQIMAAFVGVRGSTNWHFNVEGTQAIESIRAVRVPFAANTNQQYREYITGQAAPATTSKYARLYMTSTNPGTGGSAVTNQLTQSGLSVTMPQYNNYKFETTAPNLATKVSTTDGSAYGMYNVSINLNGTAGSLPANSKVWSYCSAGTDFTCLFFLNVPTMWYYSVIPVAP